MFDGIVIAEHHGSGGHRFADADEVKEIHQGAVLLALDRNACKHLPKPSANPAVMRDHPAETAGGARVAKLKRAWDYISGNY